MKKLLLLLSVPLVLFQACQKDDLGQDKEPNSIVAVDTDMDIMHKSFAKTLAKAVESNNGLRELIKNEALKQFDKDYDVLYQQIRNSQVNGETVADIMAKHAESAEELERIENELPLLTIFVPNLPKFSAETWNVNTDVPMVAAAVSNRANVPVYNAVGEEFQIPTKATPAVPVIVVKQNERVKLGDGSSVKSSGKFSYEFADEAFDPAHSEHHSTTKGNIQTEIYDETHLDIVNGSANVGYQRDFIYYNIDINNTNGSFCGQRAIKEHIHKIKLKSIDDFNRISQTELADNGSHGWVDGNLELYFAVSIPRKSSFSPLKILRKTISVSPNDLFNFEPGTSINYQDGLFYFLKPTPKWYNLNWELEDWDLGSYAAEWLIYVEESDIYNTSNDGRPGHDYNIYWNVNFSENFECHSHNKKGTGWGNVSPTSGTRSYFTVTTPGLNREIGRAIMRFWDPFIIMEANQNNQAIYRTMSTSNGEMEFLIAPMDSTTPGSGSIGACGHRGCAGPQ